MKKLYLIPAIIIIMIYIISCGKNDQDKKIDENPLSIAATRFTDLLIEQKFEEAFSQFDSTMTEQLPLEKLKATWLEIADAVGPFSKHLGTKIEKADQHDVVSVTLRFLKFTMDVRVVYDEQQRVAGLFFRPSETPHDFDPPGYVNRDLFEEQELTFGDENWLLPATLSIPKKGGPFPAVVLVHGSGPQDRNESIGPNKPFRDIAWGLASQGIAVFRYEKRTREHGARIAAAIKSITVRQETVEDALLAVAKLREIDNIDDQRIFVLGHSLGGMMIPRIGMEDKDIAGFIVLAGAARPMEDMIIEQLRHLLSVKDTATAKDSAALEQLEAKIQNVKNPNLSIEADTTDLPYGLPASYWLDLRGYEPAKAATKLNRPMLILQGEQDFQSTMADFRLWKESLESFDNVTFKSYPDLNHLFITSDGTRTPREYYEQKYVEEEVVDLIADWIKKH